jgi:hypothetical protein
MRITLGEVRQLIREILGEKGEVVVYHASPKLSLDRIMPRYSPKFGTKGIFVTSDRGSILRSWADWALRKPSSTKTGRTSDRYESIAIYTIRIPKDMFDASEAYHSNTAQESGGGPGAWGWDVETFIPEELMPNGYLTPTSKKEYSQRDMQNADVRSDTYKRAGQKPEEPESLSPTGKNPAKELFSDLKRKVATADLRRGGRIGTPTNWPINEDPPQQSLDASMDKLRSMAEKPRLSSSETAELNDLVATIEDLIGIQVKALPQGTYQPDKDSTRTPKQSHVYRRSARERRGQQD